MRIVIYLLILTFLYQTSNGQGIKHYALFTGKATTAQGDFVLLRTFEQKGKRKYLAVNVRSLATCVLVADEVVAAPSSWQQLKNSYANTPYIHAINNANQRSFNLQDAGVIHGYPAEKGITLTVDLCPSHKPLDSAIFTALIKEFSAIEKPVPIGLSISGRFLLQHQKDMEWIDRLQRNRQIDVTWINHTYSHYYDPKVPLTKNFLLKPGTNVNNEVLKLEQLLLEKNLMPSVFFRFPGLVSDNEMVTKITALGLLPIGSDAWLAKGNQAKNGSIVLIHGNGNEPIGVMDFIKLIQTKAALVKSKQWLMYDLRNSISAEFQQ